MKSAIGTTPKPPMVKNQGSTLPQNGNKFQFPVAGLVATGCATLSCIV